MRNKIIIFCVSISLLLFFVSGCDLVPDLDGTILGAFQALEILMYVIYVADGQLEFNFEDPETGATQSRTGPADSYGRPYGDNEIEIPLVPLVPQGKVGDYVVQWNKSSNDTIYYKVKGHYQEGKRHGWHEYFYPDGTLYDRVYYEDGKRSDPPDNNGTDVSNIYGISSIESEIVSFRLLQEAYPWFLFKMKAYGFEPDKVENFMAALQSRIVFYAPWSESDFSDAFRESVDDIRENDTLLVRLYEFIAGIEAMIHLRSFELRLAIIDRYHGKGESTFEILEEHYPDFHNRLLTILNEDAVKAFSDDLDERMDSEGPVDLEDPAYIEIIDERILNALNEMFNSFAHPAILLVLHTMVTDMIYGANPIHEALKATYFTTSVNDDGGDNTHLPTRVSLEQNYPNPFNPTTNIRYSIAETTPVQLIVYDTVGKEVAILVDKIKNPGNYVVLFDASHLSSGVYLYQLRAGDHVETKRLVLVK